MKELFQVRAQYASKGSSAVRPTNGLYLLILKKPKKAAQTMGPQY
jgi:hypothetical protein